MVIFKDKDIGSKTKQILPVTFGLRCKESIGLDIDVMFLRYVVEKCFFLNKVNKKYYFFK